MSSDPKPREGTETLRRRIRDLFPRIGRQTQNPERGRKLPRRLAITTPTNGRQTQNPERGRKPAKYRLHDTTTTRRQTQNPERGRKPAKYRLHDTTTTRRQTQNPERGRKLLTMRLPRALFQPSSDPKPREGTETGSRQTGSRRSSPVVRPKTPRGDGNFITPDQIGIGVFKSSDPKPREGTETFAKSPRPHRRSACRQTQNPERGRKPASGKSVRSKRFQRVVRPKTPRGDVNSKSSTTSAAAACSRSRQTQNPERGRKHGNAAPA